MITNGKYDDCVKALNYYKTAALQNRINKKPKFVPCLIRISHMVRGDFPFTSLRLEPGEYECQCNQWGAVSVKTKSGELLGLRLDEFEPIAWKENTQGLWRGFFRTFKFVSLT